MRPRAAVSSLIPAVATGAIAGGLAELGVLVVEEVERRFTGAPPHSDVPGEAVRVPTSLHLAHGAVWGVLHGAGRAADLGTIPTVALHGAATLATDSVLLRTVGLTGAPWTWSRADLATSIARAGVYAALTGVVWSMLRRPS